MKTISILVALSTLVITPALAQSAKHSTRHARATLEQTHSGNSRYDVYVGGKYVGRDPDAFIRMQLMADPAQGGNDSAGGGGE